MKCSVGEAGEEGFGGDCERLSMERKALVAIIADVQSQPDRSQVSTQESCKLAVELVGRSNKQCYCTNGLATRLVVNTNEDQISQIMVSILILASKKGSK